MLFNSFRRLNSRRFRRGVDATPLEILESRTLLTATLIQEVPDVEVGADSHSIALNHHFDDTEISGSVAEVATPFGTFFIETYDDITPQTAANFVQLVNEDRYRDMFFHRLAPGFVLQGGGYSWLSTESNAGTVQNNGTVQNEFDNWFDPQLGGLAEGTPLNTRGTIAMAKLGGDPNSATSQWFVNLSDNSENLDGQNGGFTVFAHVLFDGMTVVDTLAGLSRVNAGAPLDSLPVRDFEAGTSLTRDHLIISQTTLRNELAFEISGNTNSDIVAATLIAGQLQLTAADGATGSTEITIVATDLQGNSVSDTFTVAITAPAATTITGPVDVDGSRPTIEWNSIANATGYELWVNHVGVQNAIIRETSLTTNSFTPAQDLADGQYRAWVRTKNESGASDWSAAFNFTIGLQAPSAVSITSPSESVSNETRPLIEWTESDGATEYDLWVNHVGVQNQVIREQSLTTTNFTPDTDLADGTYRVWVLAKNAAGRSAWSAGRTFQIQSGAVQLTGPTGDAISSRPEITWTGDAESTYELWVNQVGGSARVIHETAVQGLSFTPDSDLSEGEYRAWVRHRSQNEPAGPWTPAYSFFVGTDTRAAVPAVPTITALDTGRPIFSFSETQNAVRYELWVNQVGGSARVIHELQLTELQFQSANELTAGTYRGWLRAFNSDDQTGGWSSAFSFEIA